MSIAVASEKSIKVPLGGVEFSFDGRNLETLLGSCVGVLIWCPVTKIAGLSHVVLFNSRGDDSTPGKYADTAVPFMRNELLRHGASHTRMCAKITGGATMFGDRKATDVGEMNHLAVREALAKLGIPILAAHIGGRQGRVVKCDCSTGKVEVHIGMKLSATI